MNRYTSSVEPIIWRDNHLSLMDQRLLPNEVTYIDCYCCSDVIDAIKEMVVRGAPAIGVSAAYGVALAARQCLAENESSWQQSLAQMLDELRQARPTAINLAWAIDRMQSFLNTIPKDATASDVESTLISAAVAMHEQDITINQTMGDLGASLLAADTRVITHCNAGALATAGYGTALGVIRSAYRDKRLREVFACETRPWLQGARLTAWELSQDHIPVTLIADHAAAQLMATSDALGDKIGWVITGADRVAANGDVANKIGTYSLALAARAHDVGMMVVAPTSTIDLATSSGRDIPIEQRHGDELLNVHGTRIAPAGVPALNPVFDVTPAGLIDVLVTEKGVIKHPNEKQITALF